MDKNISKKEFSEKSILSLKLRLKKLVDKNLDSSIRFLTIHQMKLANIENISLKFLLLTIPKFSDCTPMLI